MPVPFSINKSISFTVVATHTGVILFVQLAVLY